MKVYVLKYFFNGDDLENEVKGVYTDRDRAITELSKLVQYENENNITDYDRPFEKINELKFQGYAQHFGSMFYEIEIVELDKGAEANKL